MTEARAGSAGRRARTRLAAWVGALVVRLLGWTWRVRLEGTDELALAAREGGVVLALWHGELLPLLWVHRGRGVAPLVSTHADGEIIARVAASLGCVPIRGSTSRGGARALLEAVRELRGGTVVAITPDGPRGPRRVCSPGVGVAAAKAGVAVVAMGCRVDRAWRLRSWDRFVIPKPFARLELRYAPPVRAAGTQAADGEGLVASIDAGLRTVSGPDAA